MNPPTLIVRCLLASALLFACSFPTWAAAAPPAPSIPLPPAIVEPSSAHSLFRPNQFDPPPSRSLQEDVRGGQAPAAFKIAVIADGVYRLTHADLLAAGFAPEAFNPTRFALHHRGRPVAIDVTGADDGRFDPGDEIRFYAPGIPITAPEAIYTRVDMYWLSVAAEPGLRMARRRAAEAGNGPSATLFRTQHYAEEDSAYWQAMPPDQEGDRWFWGGRLSYNTAGLAARRAYTVTLGVPAGEGEPAELTVYLKGFTADDHRTRLAVNGATVSTQEWTGQARFVQQAPVDPALLRAGDNVIEVESLDSGALVDQVLVDAIGVIYDARFHVRNDRLAFTTPAGERVIEVTGFSDPDILLFDLSDPAAPVLVTPTYVTAADGSSGFRFHADHAAPYLAVTERTLLTPVQTRVDLPSSWRTTAHGADLVIIGHRAFLSPIERLAADRRTQGLRVVVVPVDDLYDEFGHGLFTPYAIRDFLTHAHASWRLPAPRYALLVGDAYQDYRNLLSPAQSGLVNWVPAQVVETELLGETSSDTWFGNTDTSTAVPEVAIGRLPVADVTTLDAIIDKLIAHDVPVADGSANATAVLVADDDDSGFGLATRRLAAQLPDHVAPRFIDAAAYPPGDPTADLLGELDAGASLVHYSGHGDVTRWGNWQGGSLLTAGDVDAIRGPPVFVTMANCLSNFFAGPAVSLGEALLQHSAGALAVWGPTGLGTPTAHGELMHAFYGALFHEEEMLLGDATLAAFRALPADAPATQDLIATYALLGDPTTPLPRPRLVPDVLLPIIRQPP